MTLNDRIAHLPAWFRELPLGRDVIREQEEQRRDERRKVIAEIMAIEAERTKEQPKRDKVIAAAAGKLGKARTALSDAERDYMAARRAAFSASNHYEREFERRRRSLRLTADPRIAEAIEWCYLECERLMRMQPISEVDVWARQHLNFETVGSNLPAIQQRLAWIREQSIPALERLMEQEIDDLPAAISQILGDIPQVPGDEGARYGVHAAPSSDGVERQRRSDARHLGSEDRPATVLQ